MSKMSDYLEEQLLNCTLRGIAFVPPAHIYLALYTTDPKDDNTGFEVEAGEYQRQEVIFDAPAGGEVANNNEIIYPMSLQPWGTVTHVALFDAQMAGNLLYSTPLPIERTIDTHNQYIVKPGQMFVKLD
jgi:hypothetical protein